MCLFVKAVLFYTDHTHNLCNVGWLLEFYIQATSKVISGLISTCDSVRSWIHYSAAQLRDHAARYHELIDIPVSHIILLPSQRVLGLS